MDQHDVERIARAALKELGVPATDLSIVRDGRADHWRIEIRNNPNGPGTLRLKCGQGSTAEWVRTQIFDQITR